MSKLICASAIDGAIDWIAKADAILAETIKQKGIDHKAGFPDTAYYLPIVHSFTGMKVETLGDLQAIMNKAKSLIPERVAEKVWLPYLGKALDAGAGALFACEVIEACKYLIGPNPVDGIWLGAATDVIMRERGIEFVDGSAPGFAAITGAAPTNEIAVQIAKELQEKNLYVFMAGEDANGRQFAEQLAEEGVQLGWDTRLVSFGKDVSALVYALGFANRAALSFGGVNAGDFESNLKYNKDRIFAFVMALGEVTPAKYAIAAGAINYGFPVIADTDIPEVLPTGICTYEHVVANVTHDVIVEKCLEVRGCKIKITDVPIPVAYGPAFGGERIRKADVHAEFGGNKTTGFEFVTTLEMDEINDGEIELIGPDIDTVEEGATMPLAIWVEVAGRKMQDDFEPILERQIHHLVNGAEGIWHMGQRDIIWTRVSKTGFKNGIRLKHYGEILHAKLLSDYPAIVDKVKVTMITDEAEVEKRLIVAKKVYDERNRRLESMTDDNVELFYSCLLCQSFAPDHVCIITPERLGLCGAYNWLDGKAAYEIDETGPNQPVQKGRCIDERRGVWEGVDEYVAINSHKAIESFSAYSIMNNPMTSCGCFEAICAYVPECNGVMVVNREFLGETPIGMTFSALAGSVGGGQQTPGFMGCGKVFLTSKKFLFAEGGFKRLVWMPKELKNQIGADLKLRYDEQDIGDVFEKIADETVATSAEETKAYLEKVSHPVIEMEDMAIFAEEVELDVVESDIVIEQSAEEVASVAEKSTSTQTLTPDLISEIKNQVAAELKAEIKTSVAKEVVADIIATLSGKYLGAEIAPQPTPLTQPTQPTQPKASARIAELQLDIKKSKCEVPVWEVKLGATKEEGGTRSKSYTIGGETCMPFHLWEGVMPNRPLVAMEVFDLVSAKYPQSLRDIYGDLLENPVEMAKVCVEKYGADLISVRLEGTHPDKGDKSTEESVKLVKDILAAVDVPLIVTGHNNFDKNNEVLKAVAAACAGEKLLLNYVENDNYKTIAGAAMAYGHALVAQSPIDVNIGKQLNILLGNMDIKTEQIVMDAMTGAAGYGIEYTYSVMERIRYTAINGDKQLAGPMIVSPGQECAKIKELKATEADFPEWGDLAERAAIWELTTATNLLYAGADLLIMYHPEAVMELKKTIDGLMDK